MAPTWAVPGLLSHKRARFYVIIGKFLVGAFWECPINTWQVSCQTTEPTLNCLSFWNTWPSGWDAGCRNFESRL